MSRNHSENKNGVVSPLDVLKEAIKQEPSMKFALALAGVAACIAIVLAFIPDLKTAFVTIVVAIALMFILIIFSKAAKSIPGGKALVAITTWSITFLFILTLGILWASEFNGRLESAFLGAKKITMHPLPTSTLAPSSSPENKIEQQSQLSFPQTILRPTSNPTIVGSKGDNTVQNNGSTPGDSFIQKTPSSSIPLSSFPISTEEDKKVAATYVQDAIAFYSRGDYEEAMNRCKKALRMDKNSIEAKRWLKLSHEQYKNRNTDN